MIHSQTNMASPGIPSWKRKVELLQQRYERLAAGAREDTFLLKALATLQKLTKLFLNETATFDISSYLQLYSQAILDVTFFEENRLVDEDFLRDESLDEVKQLIDLLSDPERLVEEVNQHQEGSDVTLEVDVLECLHWRRGALLYMFCHTVGERECWILQNKKTFQQCLQDGVFHLLRMLRTRNPLVINHEVSFQDLNTANLLSNGIFSDIHLLALMYCGEMCYWALKYGSDGQSSNSNTQCDSEPQDQSQDRLIPFQKVGENALEKYVSVCEGPLSGKGWNTDKAKDILKFFKEDSL